MYSKLYLQVVPDTFGPPDCDSDESETDETDVDIRKPDLKEHCHKSSDSIESEEHNMTPETSKENQVNLEEELFKEGVDLEKTELLDLVEDRVNVNLCMQTNTECTNYGQGAHTKPASKLKYAKAQTQQENYLEINNALTSDKNPGKGLGAHSKPQNKLRSYQQCSRKSINNTKQNKYRASTQGGSYTKISSKMFKSKQTKNTYNENHSEEDNDEEINAMEEVENKDDSHKIIEYVRKQKRMQGKYFIGCMQP